MAYYIYRACAPKSASDRNSGIADANYVVLHFWRGADTSSAMQSKSFPASPTQAISSMTISGYGFYGKISKGLPSTVHSINNDVKDFATTHKMKLRLVPTSASQGGVTLEGAEENVTFRELNNKPGRFTATLSLPAGADAGLADSNGRVTWQLRISVKSGGVWYDLDAVDVAGDSNYKAISQADHLLKYPKAVSAPSLANAACADDAEITVGNPARTPLAFFGDYVQGKSVIGITADIEADAVWTVTTTLTGPWGALVQTYQQSAVSVTGAKVAVFDTADLAGAASCVVEIEDVCGYSDSYAFPAFPAVLPYAPPAIPGIAAVRYAEVPTAGGTDYEEDDGGSLVALIGAMKAWDLNGLNPAVLTVAFTENGQAVTLTQTHSQGLDIDADSPADAGGRSVFTVNGAPRQFSETSDYQFTITLADLFGSAQAACQVYKDAVLFNVEKHGVGVGMHPGRGTAQAPAFECGWPAYFDGNVAVTGDAAFGGNVAVGAGKLLKVVNVTVASSLSIAGGSSADCSATVNPGAGWTPVCTTGTRCNNGRIIMRRVYLSGNTVHVEPVNTGTSTYTIGIQADVLCVRTSL